MNKYQTFGLDRSERLCEAKDFLRLKRSGKRTFGKTLTYVTCPNDFKHPRVGCIVSRKTGNAVVRNKWKRVMREFFRAHKPLFSTSTDHLWIVKASTVGKPPVTIFQEMKTLLGKERPA
ncbi:MAG: ribonuclease P protein component [Bdellovibrionales bacterium]|nr:ribonuclease P protein component [Bdellovibrionales bacterium]